MTGFSPLTRIDFCLELAPQDRLRVRGGDARDFLQRIGATDLRDLAEGAPRHAIFTDDKGRLIDAPLVASGPDGFRLFAGPGRGTELRAWLEKWIIVDDVTVDTEPEPAWLLGEADLGPGRVLRPRSSAGPAIGLDTAPGNLVDLARWDAACLRAGRLFAGTATALRPNPLELGWEASIAFDKGCYIGQEVIARMHNYEKVRRRLAVVSLATRTEPGAAITSDGRKRGELLACVSLDEGPFGWAILDRTLEPGASLDAGTTLLYFA